MVPARNQCHPGWNLEYSGYLFGAYKDFASAQYICVDTDAEAVPGGSANSNGQQLFIVEGVCGSLPCPPYQKKTDLCGLFQMNMNVQLYIYLQNHS